MKVNDLIELLEYSPAQAPVTILVVDAEGQVVRHDAPSFLSQDGRVYIVVDERPQTEGRSGTPTEEIVLADYERPQLFGHRLVWLRMSDQAASRRTA